MNICSTRQAFCRQCASAASNANVQAYQKEDAGKASQNNFGFLLDSLILSLPLSPLSIGLSLLAHCCCIMRHVHQVRLHVAAASWSPRLTLAATFAASRSLSDQCVAGRHRKLAPPLAIWDQGFYKGECEVDLLSLSTTPGLPRQGRQQRASDCSGPSVGSTQDKLLCLLLIL